MSNRRLSEALLAHLQNIAKPGYDRTRLTAGILHIGVGAFHRAHQAVYTDDVLNRSGGDWGIIGASLRRVFLRVVAVRGQSIRRWPGLRV